MRLVTFSDAQGMRVGVHDSASDTIVDITAAKPVAQGHDGFVALGRNGLQRARPRAQVRASTGFRCRVA